MEYFDKPGSATLRGIINTETKKPVTLTADEFLDQIVWTVPVWRSTKDHMEAMRRLRPAIAAVAEGEEVEATKADHEKLLQCLQSLDVTQRPHLAEVTSDFAYALMCSRHEAKPKSLPEPALAEAAPPPALPS